MIEIVIYLTQAIFCIEDVCHNALVNLNTPTGEYWGVRMQTLEPGYDGNIIGFLESDEGTYAIHQTYLLNPVEERERRINSDKAKDRYITNGCVNIDRDLFYGIFDSLDDIKITIKD